MAEIKTLRELTTPDPRTLHFAPLGIGGALDPDDATDFQQRVIAHCDLVPEVAEGTRNSFERIRTLHAYGVLFYEAFTVAEDLAWLLLEQALRERFMEYYGGSVPLINVTTGETCPVKATDYAGVEAAFRNGPQKRGSWSLHISSGPPMKFRGTMSDLQRWARKVGLLDGQRNKALDSIFVSMRNSVAHPHYRLSTPVASARVISDLAETINRLWGRVTPGGRLYPAPLEREVLAVAWNGAERGATHCVLRDYQLATFDEPGEWTCAVIRAVFDDLNVWDFDSRYERTNYPAELLWGPGSLADADEWLHQSNPGRDSVLYLDRIFAIRIADDRASLARRPEVALTLPITKRSGRWLVVRADFPNDAFNHGRHLKDGFECGASTPAPRSQSGPMSSCAIETLVDGAWEEMSQYLQGEFEIIAKKDFSDFRIPSRFEHDVAPDVEAD